MSLRITPDDLQCLYDVMDMDKFDSFFLHQALSVPFKCRLTFGAKRKNVNWVALPVGNEGS